MNRVARRFLLAGLAAAALPAARAADMTLSSATLTCDYLEYRSSESLVIARGNAVLVASGTRLEADEIDLDMDDKVARARGGVRLRDEHITLLAESADFDWASATGSFENGYFESYPHRLWARHIVRVSSELYHMEHAAVTSCGLDPPHYHLRIASMEYVPQKRAEVWWPRLAFGDTSVLGFPYFRKTFRKKPWSFTIDPGRSSYHGYYAKSVFSYRLTDRGTARLYWDHFDKTGEGFGGEYTHGSPLARGTIYGYRTQDRIAGTSRWNARAVHWQEIKPRLSLEINGLAQSDAGFNNLYFNDDLFRVRTEVSSDGALSYRHDYFTARLAARHDRIFDPARGSFVTLRTVAPDFSFQGSPWKVGRETYFTTAFSVRNQYDRPTANPFALDPLIPEKDRFRWTGEGSVSLRHRIGLGKKASLEPSAGVSGSWQSWRDLGATMDPADLVQGRVFTRTTFRHRFRPSWDYDLAHDYRIRWSPNRLSRDHGASLDQGLEVNQLTWVGNYHGRSLTGRLLTGYDLRDPSDQALITPRRKVTPPALDLGWRPARWSSITFREVYDLYPVRRPQTTQLLWTAGPRPDLHFSSGFSYNGGLPGELQLRHGASFPLTPSWKVEANIRYVLQGPGGLGWNAVPKERVEQEYALRRDLHCWTSRVTFRKRPGFYEAFIRIDLKSQAAVRRELQSPEEQQYYPGRDLEK